MRSRGIQMAGLLLLVGGLLIGGCGANRSGPQRPQPLPSVAILPLAGNLKVPPRTPADLVTRFWAFAQAGSVQNLVPLYAPSVRRKIGDSNIAGALLSQRPTFLQGKPRIGVLNSTAAGVLVLVSVGQPQASRAYHSYLLRGRPGAWRIVFDTILDGALPAYSQGQVRRGGGVIGARLSRMLRDAALPGPSSSSR